MKCLPVYSPDLNTIEKMWSKMKSILRRFKAKITEELDATIQTALDAVTPQDAEGRFLSCGYKFLTFLENALVNTKRQLRCEKGEQI